MTEVAAFHVQTLFSAAHTLVPGKRLRKRRRWTDGGMWPSTQINVIAGLIRQPVNLGRGRGRLEVSKAKRPPVCVAPTITASFHLPLCPFFGADELPDYCVSGVISKQPPLEDIREDCRVQLLSRVAIAVKPESRGQNTSTL